MSSLSGDETPLIVYEERPFFTFYGLEGSQKWKSLRLQVAIP